MSNRKILFFVFFILCINQSNAQLGIGSTSPDASSILDLSSTSRGFLAPRMTQAQRTGIGSPATGLLVYQTDGTSGFYYYQGAWIIIPTNFYTAGNGLTLSNTTFSLNSPVAVSDGGTGTTSFNPGSLLIGVGTSALTTNANLYWDNTNSHLGIGTTAPAQSLTVNGNAKIGAHGTTLNNIIFFASAARNVAVIAANTIHIEYFVVPNAVTNTRVVVSPGAALGDGLIISATVINTDTVEVIMVNDRGNPTNPSNMSYYFTLFH